MRATANLTAKLERGLVAYVTAASAAGVGMVVFPQPAQAKVVYTPAHVEIRYGDYNLDVNSDGAADFILSVSNGCDTNGCYGYANAIAQHHSQNYNEVEVRSGFAAALRRGAQIGPRKPFDTGANKMVQALYYSGKYYSWGPWANVHNRYLGLKFYINGELHYGWARLTVIARGFVTVTLTGYAYETISDKPIIAGNRGSTTGQGPDAEPVSLGHLALGAAGTRQHRQSVQTSTEPGRASCVRLRTYQPSWNVISLPMQQQPVLRGSESSRWRNRQTLRSSTPLPTC